MEAVAKHDFKASETDELSFTKGSVLKVIYYCPSDGRDDDDNYVLLSQLYELCIFAVLSLCLK